MNSTLLKDEKKVFNRLSNGRFATKEQVVADRQKIENERLSKDAEMYRRMYLIVAKENMELKRKFKEIQNILK